MIKFLLKRTSESLGETRDFLLRTLRRYLETGPVIGTLQNSSFLEIYLENNMPSEKQLTYWKSMKGRELGYSAWNKGTVGIMRAWNKGTTGKMNVPKGENCHFWKGGVTPINEIIRKSTEYKLWHKACFERDNWTCQKTGISGGELHVHHINNFADFPELRTSIENGITLSEKAHREFHKIYGKKNNTKEQLIDFLLKTTKR